MYNIEQILKSLRVAIGESSFKGIKKEDLRLRINVLLYEQIFKYKPDLIELKKVDNCLRRCICGIPIDITENENNILELTVVCNYLRQNC